MIAHIGAYFGICEKFVVCFGNMKPTAGLTAEDIVRHTEWRPHIYHETYKKYKDRIFRLEVLSEDARRIAMQKSMEIYAQLIVDVAESESISNWKPWMPDDTKKDLKNKTIVNLTRTAIAELYTRSAPRLLIEVHKYILKARAVASFAQDQDDTDVGEPSSSFIKKALEALGHTWMFTTDGETYDSWVEIEKIFEKIEKIDKDSKNYDWLCRYIKSSCESKQPLVTLYRLRKEMAKIEQLQILKRMKKKFEIQESSTQLHRKDLASLFDKKLSVDTCELDKSLIKVLHKEDEVKPARTVVVVCPEHDQTQIEKLSKTIHIKDIVSYLQVGADQERYEELEALVKDYNADSEEQLREIFRRRNQKSKQNVCLLDINGLLLLKVRVKTFVRNVNIVKSDDAGMVHLYFVHQSESNTIFMAVKNAHKIVQEFDYDSFTRGTAKYNMDPHSHYPYNSMHLPHRMNKNESGRVFYMDIIYNENWDKLKKTECSTKDCESTATYKLKDHDTEQICDACYQWQKTDGYIKKRIRRFIGDYKYVGYIVEEVATEHKCYQVYYPHRGKGKEEKLTEKRLQDTDQVELVKVNEWYEIEEPQSFDRYEYILIMVDLYSGYVVLEKLRVAGAKDSNLIAEAFCRRPHRAICASLKFRYDNEGIVREPLVNDMSSLRREVNGQRKLFRSDVNEVLERLKKQKGIPKYCPSKCLCKSATDCNHIAYKHMMQLLVTKVPLLVKKSSAPKSKHVTPSKPLLTKRTTRGDSTSKKTKDDKYLELLSDLINEDHEREDKTDESFKEDLFRMLKREYHQIYKPDINKTQIKQIVSKEQSHLVEECETDRCTRDMRDNIDVMQVDFASDDEMTLKKMLDTRLERENVQYSEAGAYFDECVKKHLENCEMLEEATKPDETTCNHSCVMMDSELSQKVFEAIDDRIEGTPGICFIQINKQTYNLNSTAPVEGLIKMFRDCVHVKRRSEKIKKGRIIQDLGRPSVKHNNVTDEDLQVIAETMNSMIRQSRNERPNRLFCQPHRFIKKELSHAKLNNDAIIAFEQRYRHGEIFNVKIRSRTGVHDMGYQSQQGKYVGTVKNAVILEPVECQDCRNKEIKPCKHMIPSIFNDNNKLVGRRVYIPIEIQIKSEHDVAQPQQSHSKKKKKNDSYQI